MAMSKVIVSGSVSVSSSKCDVEMAIENGVLSMYRISLGVKEVLSTFDDILSDADMLSNEDFENILDVVDQVHSLAILRAAESKCANCSNPRECANCVNFSLIHGQ